MAAAFYFQKQFSVLVTQAIAGSKAMRVLAEPKLINYFKKFLYNEKVLKDSYLIKIINIDKNSNNDILNQNATDIGSSILNKYNIKYIIVNEKYMSMEDILFATNFLK